MLPFRKRQQGCLVLEDTPGKRLAKFRGSLDISQRAFAEAVGVSPGRIGSIETDKAKPSRSFMQKLSEAYGISSDWLLNGRGAMVSDGETHPVPVRKINPHMLIFCGRAVENEYEKAGKSIDREAHFNEAVWVYNELLTRMTDLTDGEEMEAILPQIRLLLRRKLAVKS